MSEKKVLIRPYITFLILKLKFNKVNYTLLVSATKSTDELVVVILISFNRNIADLKKHIGYHFDIKPFAIVSND